MDFVRFLVPANALEWIAAGFGTLVGAIFALDWAVPRNLRSAISDPRLKSLKFFLGSFAIALIADWQKIAGSDSQIAKLHLLGFYAIPFLLSTALALLTMSCVIGWEARRTRIRTPDRYPDPPFHPVHDYLKFGYAHCQEEYERKRDQKGESEKKRGTEARLLLAASIQVLENCTDSRNSGIVAQRVLEYVCLIARSYLGYEINANYVVAVPYTSATVKQHAPVYYEFADKNRYEYLLVLQKYARPEGMENFALPVDRKVQGWEETALPGAPTAFLGRLPIVVDTEKLAFGKRVPKEIKKQIREYFRHKISFKSFISIVIPGPQYPRGINEPGIRN